MGTYEDLKAAIQQVIRTNGNNEITGALLQQTLLSIVNSVGANATFAGIATPDTNPGTADQNVYYLATEAGTYVNFGGIQIAEGEAVILSNKTGNWTKTTSGFATQQKLTELEQNIRTNADAITANKEEADAKISLNFASDTFGLNKYIEYIEFNTGEEFNITEVINPINGNLRKFAISGINPTSKVISILRESNSGTMLEWVSTPGSGNWISSKVFQTEQNGVGVIIYFKAIPNQVISNIESVLNIRIVTDMLAKNVLNENIRTNADAITANKEEADAQYNTLDLNMGALEYPEYDSTKSYKKREVVRYYGVLTQFLNDVDAGADLEGNITSISIKRIIQNELNFDRCIRNNAILPLLSSGEITIGAKLTSDKPISYADAGVANGYTNGFGSKRLLKSITYVSSIGWVRINEATIASDNTVVMKEIASWYEDTQGVVKNVELNYILGDNTAVAFSGAFAYSEQSYEGQILLKGGLPYDDSLKPNAVLFQEHYVYEGSFSELTKEQTIISELKNSGDFILNLNNSPNLISGYYTISNGKLSLNYANYSYGFKCAEVKLYGAAMTITFEGVADVPIAIIKKKDGTLKSLGTTGGKVHYITDAEILYINFFGTEYTKEFYLTGKINIDSERYNNRSISNTHSVNLLNHITKLTGKYINYLGEEQELEASYPDVYCSDYIAVNAGDIIEFSLLLKTGTENTFLGSLYNANKEKIYNDVKDIIELNGYNSGNGLLYIPYGVKYMRLNCGSTENRGNYLYINRERAYSSLLNDKKISYLGDSITYGATLEFNSVQRYSTIIEKLHNTNTQNIAVSGATTARVEGLSSVLSQVENVDNNADIVVIFSGTNDYWQKRVNIGELSESNTDDTTFVGAMNTIIRNLQARLIGKTIVWVFPFSQQWQGQNTNTDFGYGTFRQFRDAAKWACESNSIPMLDLYGNSGMNIANIDSIKSLYTNDGVHPNVEGQYRLAVLISEFLINLVA